MDKNENKQIKLEQIIAGALLNFGSLDNMDLAIILDDFIANCSEEVDKYFFIDHLNGFMYFYKDGRLTTSDEKTLDYFIDEENRTVREKYEEVAGKMVLDYFTKINVDEYKEKKKNIIKNQSEELKNKANILLISDIEEEYQTLKDYGFKNIDYFKSIIRADKYFKKHPEELEKYHIILTGNQYVQKCCFEGKVDLEDTLYKLRNKNNILETSISQYKYSDHIKYVAYLNNREIGRGWDTKESSYVDLFDRIVEAAIINHITDKIVINQEEFKPIVDYVNPDRLPLPTKKSDLKILYLDSINVNEFANDIASKLGLNISFKEDNNCSLGRYVKSHLGDYDIIIASNIYSGNILRMNNECTEQGKDSGRDLTLLVTYETDSIWYFDEDDISDYDVFGNKITLKHIFGGNLAVDDDQKYQTKQFRVLRQSLQSNCSDDINKYKQEKKSNMQAIIEESVNLYNNYLLQIDKKQLIDFDFKSAEEYDEEFAKVDRNEKKRQEEALEPINIFNSLRYKVVDYVNYRKQGLIKSDVEGIKITETTKGFCVENVLNGRTLCSIVFSKRYKEENLRVFTIQTLTNKGKLGNPEMVGLYTRKFEKLEGTPKRADEKQMNAIIATKKKIDKLIAPLNKEAWSQYINLPEKEQKRLRKKL